MSKKKLKSQWKTINYAYLDFGLSELHTLTERQMYNRVCHKNNFFEFIVPILVCHGDRNKKAQKKVSGTNKKI